MYPDGANLYLQVGPTGAKSWIFRYAFARRPHQMGLGPYPTISLAKARTKAQAARELLADGLDPLAHRDEARLKARLAAAQTITFREAAQRSMDTHSSQWSAKHQRQWEQSLLDFAYPVIGDLPVNAIGLTHVLKVLEPLWREKPQTAARLRGRIESVLNWSTVREYRTGDNPARWKGHLQELLPKIGAAVHMAAMPYADIPDLMRRLQSEDTVAARSLEFLILSATRHSETRKARWSEIDFKARTWTIPASRMKSSREHKVPLSAPALSILDKLYRERQSDLIFPGFRTGQPLASKAMARLLDRLGIKDITIHGFRSAFRSWAAEQTSFAAEVAELALAHQVGSALERAYQRSDLFARRVELAAAWGSFCVGDAPAEVVPLRRAVR
jgi:integrase